MMQYQESYFSPLAVGRKESWEEIRGGGVRGASLEEELYEKRDQKHKGRMNKVFNGRNSKGW